MLKNQKMLDPKPPPGRLECPRTMPALPKPGEKIRVQHQDWEALFRMLPEPYGEVLQSRFGLDGRPESFVRVSLRDRESKGRYPGFELRAWFYLEKNPDLELDDYERFGIVGGL